ncbi:thiamine biosynthesis protein ThiJ [Flavobacterium sp. ZT3R18]|uniref:DJ-1/PfpI family protein n=1 Tax=Flavobacterium sp. ZT3R18 TaxID=2594429 RepID=UPI00117B859B|nr:DJ-1/PfpI family protein [Flavobacterium sp. ZT3R18]TRX33246.1 thiamine biosynthesis protein ThiJ [Flavobacterium sp. ZT3R18]
MKLATIVAFDNFTDIDVFLAWDLLNRVKINNKDFEVKIVGTKDKHKSVCGIEIETHGKIKECNNADLVFFASGPETRKLYKDLDYLNQFNLNPEKQIICSMCSGALILGALGILNGITATTYPTAFEELKALGIEVIKDYHIVTHKNIGTAAGCLAAVDLLGWAIEKVYDKNISQDMIKYVLPVGTKITENLGFLNPPHRQATKR